MAKPNRWTEHRSAIRNMRDLGLSQRAMAERLGMGKTTVQAALKQIAKEEAEAQAAPKWPRQSNMKDSEIASHWREVHGDRRYG